MESGRPPLELYAPRSELSSFFGKEISRDLIGNLRGAGLVASGPRAPQPGRPTPMSPRQRSGSTLCAIFPIARCSKMQGSCRRKAAGRRHHARFSGGEAQGVIKD